MKILFIGPPGSGKGTQARMLANELKIPFVSMGDIIRDEIGKRTKLGLEARNYVIKGQLVPDETVVSILETNLHESFVLDGFPRNLSQARLFEKIEPDYVFYISLGFDEAVKRITNRRVCPECKKVYNLLTDPPQKDSICDVCGAKLMIREDDAVDTVKRRMAIYERKTYPLMKYFKKRSVLKEIDGNGGIKEVYDRIRQVFDRTAQDVPTE